MKKTLFALAVASLFCAGAQAHQIWIEPAQDQSAMVRFGEFGENLRETSPGLLDNFGRVQARLVGKAGEKPLAVSKQADGFALSAAPSNGESLVAEDAAFPLHTFKQGGKDVTSWYRPAARYATSFQAQQPALALDIVPAGAAGVFTVYLDGKPLPKAKVALVVPSGWMKESFSDEKGQVNFDLPWKGSYVLETSHIERKPGQRDGKAYDGVNYVTTLHIINPQGAEPLPAGPAEKPHH